MFLKQLKIPQIRPINWFFLFFLFNSCLLLIVIKIYNIFNKIIIKTKKIDSTNNFFLFKL